MLAAVYAVFLLFQIPLIEMSVDAQYNACPGNLSRQELCSDKLKVFSEIICCLRTVRVSDMILLVITWT